ncbi:Acyl-CoA-binding domain-containing protein 3 [Spatholobus suberectus]|nr:Acyl-CoA-binding domain-containing protein 3 [Spatholobus suberectus]
MELHAVVDDLFVTASLALLLTFLVLKLVEAMNDTHATPKRHVRREPVPHGERLTVQPAQSKSTLGSINPVQAVTCVGTEHQIPMEEAKVEPACPVPGGKRLTVQPAQNKSEVQAATCVQAEHKIEEATVEPVPPVQAAQSKSTVGFIRPVQVATCVETEHKKEEAMVESDYNVVVVSPGSQTQTLSLKRKSTGPMRKQHKSLTRRGTWKALTKSA